jgi:glycogen operon protein
MTDQDWQEPYVRCLGVRLAGDAIEEKDRKGRPIRGDTLMLLFNAHHEALPFVLPAHRNGARWEPLLDTSEQNGGTESKPLYGGESYPLGGRTLAVLRLFRRGATAPSG